MSPIERLQFAALSYRVSAVAGLVTIHARFDPDLYDVTELWAQAQTIDGAARDLVRWSRECRNDRPRLVSITQIAGRGGWIAEVAA